MSKTPKTPIEGCMCSDCLDERRERGAVLTAWFNSLDREQRAEYNRWAKKRRDECLAEQARSLKREMVREDIYPGPRFAVVQFPITIAVVDTLIPSRYCQRIASFYPPCTAFNALDEAQKLADRLNEEKWL